MKATSYSFFLSGVPCTGKSWLGTWLSEKHGYLHVDAEKQHGADLDKLGLRQHWDDMLRTGRADALVKAIHELDRPTVINWGFPPCYLYSVRAIQVAGLDTWWIGASRTAAKSAFVSRKKFNPASFEHQMDEIEKHWSLISLVFAGHIINGLDAAGAQRSPQDLWGDLLASKKSNVERSAV